MTTVAKTIGQTQISTYNLETGETTYNLPAMDAGQRFRCAISQAIEAARRRFPHSNDRIERAAELVSHVVLHPADGTATVTSSDGQRRYTVNGVCSCPDAPTKAPEGFCKHKLAVVILRKALLLVAEWKHATTPLTLAPSPLDTEAVEAAPELPVLEPVTTPVQMPTCPEFAAAVAAAEQTDTPVLEDEVVPSVPRIPREFLYDRKGTTAIRWGGLLHLATQAGMWSMQVDVVTVTPDFAVMRATAKFNDGGEWSDIGDATPANVGKEMAHAFIRMASTRAQARCLRTALNIPYVCAVELEDE